MTEREPTPARPLEETPEVAAAVDDDTAIPQFASDGGPDAQTPEFIDPDEAQGDFPPTDNLIGDAYGAGSGGTDSRTGAEQPWDPEDLAAAQGRDPDPANVERAREELAEDGPAAVERTVP
ncbi:hypothetical protein [Plantactinospora sp. CA-290183]|uniref:hypothetical protein n=1 Tax=Plantactinospora sp. CA-290183 TaxID=3240006 RepID=UPI003D8B0DCF